MPFSGLNTPIEGPVNGPARSLTRKLKEVMRWTRSIKEVAGGLWLSTRRPGFGGDAGQVDAAGARVRGDQGVEAPQQHGVHVDESTARMPRACWSGTASRVRAAAAGRGDVPAS